MSEVEQSAVTFWSNWKLLQTGAVNDGPEQGRSARSEPSDGGRLKLNTDAALDSEHNVMGLGWILRDEHGCFLAALNRRMSGQFTVVETEMLCIREALSWLKNIGMGKVDVEMDLQLFDDVKEVATSINGVNFKFAKQPANRATHALIREARSTSGCGEWYDTAPHFLVAVLAFDSMN
ncbi:PREDICTED: uncharacterized protein LOC109158009 [Ipomoea nil]|uniref:uncharacterized protein LOC109158009 n=1 Tax=Ipomoea nil TaxID=35883 RepID=UPI000900D789|nr:PREDICTED: uncharacterized protein LOC109158009 [Ipomoea nil]